MPEVSDNKLNISHEDDQAMRRILNMFVDVNHAKREAWIVELGGRPSWSTSAIELWQDVMAASKADTERGRLAGLIVNHVHRFMMLDYVVVVSRPGGDLRENLNLS